MGAHRQASSRRPARLRLLQPTRSQFFVNLCAPRHPRSVHDVSEDAALYLGRHVLVGVLVCPSY